MAQWYYSFDADDGLGPVIDIPHVSPLEIVQVVVTATPDKATSAAMEGGLFGTLIRAIYAHANEDIDRSVRSHAIYRLLLAIARVCFLRDCARSQNPDSNSPGPAYASQLSSVGAALESLADPARPTGGFAAMVAKVPALLANTTAELKSKPNARTNYSIALLA